MRIAHNGLRHGWYRTHATGVFHGRINLYPSRPYSKAKSKASKTQDVEKSTIVPDAFSGSSPMVPEAAADDKPEQIEKPISRTVSPFAVKPMGVNIPKTAEPPLLEHDLGRILFNPGVTRIQCPRTGVFNFTPKLKPIPQISRFKADRLPPYRPPAEDPELRKVFEADKETIRYIGATSTCTGVLQHLHYLISNWRPGNIEMFSKGFSNGNTLPTRAHCAPHSIILKNVGAGQRIMSSDFKFGDEAKELMQVGHMLELKLTVPDEEFQKWLEPAKESANSTENKALGSIQAVANTTKVDDQPTSMSHSYNYLQIGSFLVRSQLDARHPRLATMNSGRGYFDIKTRAALAVRMDPLERSTEARNYPLKSQHGLYSSFEREMFDLVKTMLLKYSLQARLGQMEGIFIAYHNLTNMLGFQYLSIPDMDEMMHGQRDDYFGKYTGLGGQELRISVLLLEHIFDTIVSKFPSQDTWIHFDSRRSSKSALYIFVEEVNDELLEGVAECTNELVSIAKRVAEEYEAKKKPLAGSHLVAECESSLAIMQDLNKIVQRDEISVLKHGKTLSAQQLAPMVVQYLQLAQHYAKFKVDDKADDERGKALVDRTMQKIQEAMKTVEAFAHKLPEDLQVDAFALGKEMHKGDKANEKYVWKHKPKKLVGLRIDLQNHVDGEPVARPEKLGPKQKWSVDYTITTLRDEEARRRYGDMLKRKMHLKNAEYAAMLYESSFYQTLQTMSSGGRRWERHLMQRYRANEARHQAALKSSGTALQPEVEKGFAHAQKTFYDDETWEDDPDGLDVEEADATLEREHGLIDEDSVPGLDQVSEEDEDEVTRS